MTRPIKKQAGIHVPRPGSGAEAMLLAIHRRGAVPVQDLYCIVRRAFPSIRRRYFLNMLVEYRVVTWSGLYRLPDDLSRYFDRITTKPEPAPGVAGPREINHFTEELDASKVQLLGRRVTRL